MSDDDGMGWDGLGGWQAGMGFWIGRAGGNYWSGATLAKVERIQKRFSTNGLHTLLLGIANKNHTRWLDIRIRALSSLCYRLFNVKSAVYVDHLD